MYCNQVKTTNPKKYCVRPNTGIVLPRSTCDVIGALINVFAHCFILASVYLFRGLLNLLVHDYMHNYSYYASTEGGPS